MSHSVEGFIANLNALQSATRNFNHSNVVALDAGFGLLLNTDEFYDEVVQGLVCRNEVEKVEVGVFWKFHPKLEEFALRISRTEPVLYFETEYWGGSGTQAAVAWQNGTIVFGPAKADSVSVQPHAPISSALRMIGVNRGPNQLDEFDTVGLGRFRSNKDWILQPSFGRSTLVVKRQFSGFLEKLCHG